MAMDAVIAATGKLKISVSNSQPDKKQARRERLAEEADPALMQVDQMVKSASAPHLHTLITGLALRKEAS